MFGVDTVSGGSGSVYGSCKNRKFTLTRDENKWLILEGRGRMKIPTVPTKLIFLNSPNTIVLFSL